MFCQKIITKQSRTVPQGIAVWCQRSRWNSNGVIPIAAQNTRPVGKKLRLLTITLENGTKIDAKFIWKVSTKSYMLYRILTFPIWPSVTPITPNYPYFSLVSLVHMQSVRRTMYLTNHSVAWSRSRGPFYPRDAIARILAVAVCLSVRLSQVGVLLKRLNPGSRKQRHTIAQGSSFLTPKI